MTSTRKTFVVSVRDQDGPATVHEVRTGRKARLTSVDASSPGMPRFVDVVSPDQRVSTRFLAWDIP